MLDHELRVRIVIQDSPPTVRWAAQEGSGSLLAPVRVAANLVVFELDVRVVHNRAGNLDFRGGVVQGRPGGRFVYLNSSSSAARWDRRAKISLQSILAAQLDDAIGQPTMLLEARIHGLARDGGAACASVALLGDGWVLALR